MANNFIKGGRPLKSRIEWLLESYLMSDLKFIVGEEMQEFPGHKLVFAVSSHDFYNGFYAMTPEDNIIRLPEIQVAAFKEFLRYIYTEEADINSDNILDILRLAERYEIEHLMVFCFESAGRFIDDELQLVGSLLKIGISCKDQSPIFAFLSIISKDPLKFLTLVEIGYLTRDHLKFILEDVDTKASEVELFELAVMWAGKILSSTDPVKIRTVLGDLIQLIRFPTMSLTEFEQCVEANEGVLESKDAIDITLFISNNKKVCKYPIVKRKVEAEKTVNGSEMLIEISKLNEAVSSSTVLYNNGSYSSLYFSVKEKCLLEKIYFYVNGKISSKFRIGCSLYCVGPHYLIEDTYINYTSLNSSESKDLLGQSIEPRIAILKRKILLEPLQDYRITLRCDLTERETDYKNTMLVMPKYSNEIVLLNKTYMQENNKSPIAGLTLKRV